MVLWRYHRNLKSLGHLRKIASRPECSLKPKFCLKKDLPLAFLTPQEILHKTEWKNSQSPPLHSSTIKAVFQFAAFAGSITHRSLQLNDHDCNQLILPISHQISQLTDNSSFKNVSHNINCLTGISNYSETAQFFQLLNLTVKRISAPVNLEKEILKFFTYWKAKFLCMCLYM